jgi:uncharacterized protein (DUF433 family)
VDETTGLSFGMDMTPLINGTNIEPQTLVAALIQNFSQDVSDRFRRIG